MSPSLSLLFNGIQGKKENRIYACDLRLYRFILILSMALSLSAMLGACKDAPAIPHKVANTSADSCRTCHQNGDNGAPKVSHSGKNNCLDCHNASANIVGMKESGFSSKILTAGAIYFGL